MTKRLQFSAVALFCVLSVALLMAENTFAQSGDPVAAINPTQNGPIPACPWLHQGLTMYYLGKHSITQGAQFQISPNGGGQFVTQDGQAFDITRRETSAASVVIDRDTITAIDGDKIAWGTRTYAFDILNMNNPPRPAGMVGGITTLAQRPFGARFLDPALLKPYIAAAANPATAPAGISIARFNLAVGNHNFDAIGILARDANSQTMTVYDTQTGIELRWMNVTRDAAPQTYVAGDKPYGDLHVGIVDLIGARDLNIPGGNDPLPPALANAQTIHLTTITKFPQLPYSQPMRSDNQDQITDRGTNWIKISSQDPQTGQTATNVTGSDQWLGWWMSPAALARMQPGQVLDEDPFVRSRLVVAHMDDRFVAITDTSNDVKFSMQFDRRTGVATATRRTGGVPPADITTQVTWQ